jgi:hypothetical protein
MGFVPNFSQYFAIGFALIPATKPVSFYNLLAAISSDKISIGRLKIALLISAG